MRVVRRNGKTIEMKHDELYTLIGYSQTEEDFEMMGIKTHPLTGCALYDYDGEFQRAGKSKGSRLYKGYFGIGSVLKSPTNPNSVVIPGMVYAMPDLLFGVIMRSYEYQSRRNNHRNERRI